MLDAIDRAIRAADSILITGPVDLDGDAVGAMVGLAIAVRRTFPGKTIRVVADEPVPARYRFMNHPDAPFELGSATGPEPVDLSIVCDGDPARLGSAGPHYEAARVRGQIDHHKSSDPAKVDAPLIDASAASTTQLVFDLCQSWGVELDQALAAPLFAGLAFDTSVFRYRLTTPRALRTAARLLETGIDHARIVEQVLLEQSVDKVRLRARMIGRMQVGAEGALAWSTLTSADVRGVDSGGLVDDLVFLEGVEVGALLMEKPDGRVKLSLRSRGGVDVSKLARRLTTRGGGHARAAGATLEGPMVAAEKAVVEAATAALAEAPVSSRDTSG